MEQDLARARTFTKVLDRYGLDPILGFFLPGVGDLIGSLLGLYLVVVAAKHKASPLVIARMLMNLAFDALIGFTPVVGDVADFLFHANERNLALLESRPTGKAKAADWILVVGAFVVLLSALGLTIYGFVRLVQWL